MSKKIVSIIFSLLATNTLYAAGNSPVAITAKIGTMGAGVDLTYKISHKINARLNANKGDISGDLEDDGIEYNGVLNTQTTGALIDFHPSGGGFRISAGLYSNKNQFNLNASPSAKEQMIGDLSYQFNNANLGLDIGFKSTAPYLGIGWGNAVKQRNRWSFSVDTGILFQGSPNIAFNASGTGTETITGQTIDFSNNPLFQSELKKEEATLKEELDDFKFFPVLSLGVAYHF